jgi:hypothetical protein
VHPITVIHSQPIIFIITICLPPMLLPKPTLHHRRIIATIPTNPVRVTRSRLHRLGAAATTCPRAVPRRRRRLFPVARGIRAATARRDSSATPRTELVCCTNAKHVRSRTYKLLMSRPCDAKMQAKRNCGCAPKGKRFGGTRLSKIQLC